MAGPHTARARARELMISDIKRLALEQLSREGAAQLSLRAIARELDLVPSGTYRYYAGRDELLTALIIDAYADLGGAVAGRRPGPAADPLPTALGGALPGAARWAIQQPHRFQLLYGTPVPGYRAPSDTIAPAAEIIAALFGVPAEAAAAGALTPPADPTGRAFRRQLTAVADALAVDLSPGAVAAASAAFAEIVGLVADSSSAVTSWAATSRPTTSTRPAWTAWPTGSASEKHSGASPRAATYVYVGCDPSAWVATYADRREPTCT